MTRLARSPRDTQVVLNQLMLPEHANMHGNVHGGVVMKMMDEAGAIAATRHARQPCVTVAIDSMFFHSPVHVGELVRCSGTVTWVGRSSIEVEVQVSAEELISGRCTHTNSAHFVYVALDTQGKPAEVPDLILETDTERESYAAAAERRAHRLALARRPSAPPCCK